MMEDLENSAADANQVKIGILTPKNFKIWSYKAKLVLNTWPGALDLLAGTVLEPFLKKHFTSVEKMAYEKELHSFQTLNSAVRNVLTTNMSEEVLEKVGGHANARNMWLELEKLYHEESSEEEDETSALICSLKFLKYKRVEGHTVPLHLTALNNLWENLNEALHLEYPYQPRLPDIILITKILDTLPPAYDRFKKLYLRYPRDCSCMDYFFEELNTYEENYLQHFNLKRICSYCHVSGHNSVACQKWKADVTAENQALNINFTVLRVDSEEAEAKAPDCVDKTVPSGTLTRKETTDNNFN